MSDQQQNSDPMDSNEFDSLMEDVDTDVDDGRDGTSEADNERQTTTSSSQTDTSQSISELDSRSHQSSLRDRTPTVDVGDSDPGFPFETQESVYLTEESWNNFDDLKHAVETYLRNEFDIRNVQGRELDEVFFRLAVDQLRKEDIGDLIVRLRGFDPESER
ncbi:hypothetical protein [Haloarcula marismortui]|nr:hypothetical protein [Haloarcula californiae]